MFYIYFIYMHRNTRKLFIDCMMNATSLFFIFISSILFRFSLFHFTDVVTKKCQFHLDQTWWRTTN